MSLVRVRAGGRDDESLNQLPKLQKTSISRSGTVFYLSLICADSHVLVARDQTSPKKSFHIKRRDDPINTAFSACLLVANDSISTDQSRDLISFAYNFLVNVTMILT